MIVVRAILGVVALRRVRGKALASDGQNAARTVGHVAMVMVDHTAVQ